MYSMGFLKIYLFGFEEVYNWFVKRRYEMGIVLFLMLTLTLKKIKQKLVLPKVSSFLAVQLRNNDLWNPLKKSIKKTAAS